MYPGSRSVGHHMVVLNLVRQVRQAPRGFLIGQTCTRGVRPQPFRGHKPHPLVCRVQLLSLDEWPASLRNRRLRPDDPIGCGCVGVRVSQGELTVTVTAVMVIEGE